MHTKAGLLPIEQIRVGDLVLSQPGNGEDRDYRRVTATTTRKNQEVLLFEYIRGDAEAVQNLVLTGGHPVWVKDLGWTPARDLGVSHEIELADDSSGAVVSVRRIFQTDLPQVGWTHYDGRDIGPTIDLRNGQVSVSAFLTGDAYVESALEIKAWLTSDVHDLEVEEFHTFYVGEEGVWVHDASAHVA